MSDGIAKALDRADFMFARMGGVKRLQDWYDEQEEAGRKVTGQMIMEARQAIERELGMRT